MRKIGIFIIKAYQFLFGSFLGSCCRFYPSCSNYAILAIQKHGFIRGCFYSILRILRCNRWSKGGYDPI